MIRKDKPLRLSLDTKRLEFGLKYFVRNSCLFNLVFSFKFWRSIGGYCKRTSRKMDRQDVFSIGRNFNRIVFNLRGRSTLKGIMLNYSTYFKIKFIFRQNLYNSITCHKNKQVIVHLVCITKTKQSN